MPLINALRSGVDLANAMKQGNILSAQARYAYPMTQADLERMRLANQYQGIINQYQPEKSRLTNQSLGLSNVYQDIINQYQPDKSRLANEQAAADLKFTPVKYAIEVENAMRNNSRFGGAYQYLKSVADLPAEQRSAFLADPDNYNQYMEMIGQLHESVKTNRTSVLTPSLLKQAGLNSIAEDVMSNAPPSAANAPSLPVSGGLSAPLNNNATMNAPVGAQPSVNVNVPQQIPSAMPPQMQTGGMAAPLPRMTPIGASPVMPPPQMTPMAQPPIQPPMQPQAAPMPQGGGNMPMGNQPPVAPQPQVPDVKQVPGLVDRVMSTPTDQLTPSDKTYLSFMAVTNKKMAGAPATNRAVGAVTLEKFIQDNKDIFADRLKNASLYAGWLGKGKEYADKLSGKQPQTLQDYNWVVNDFIPQLANNVRIMEKLSITPHQQEQINNMTQAAFKWYQSPESAIKYINMNFDMFSREAQAALDAAQPYQKGVLEKLYGIGKGGTNPDYVQGDISKASTADLLRMYQGGK